MQVTAGGSRPFRNTQYSLTGTLGASNSFICLQEQTVKAAAVLRVAGGFLPLMHSY